MGQLTLMKLKQKIFEEKNKTKNGSKNGQVKSNFLGGLDEYKTSVLQTIYVERIEFNLIANNKN